jgi:hypothetical protein
VPSSSEIIWVDECQYISCRTETFMRAERLGRKAHVPEMKNDPEVFLRYCRMQKAMAEREGKHDSAQYIQHCIDELEERAV